MGYTAFGGMSGCPYHLGDLGTTALSSILFLGLGSVGAVNEGEVPCHLPEDLQHLLRSQKPKTKNIVFHNLCAMGVFNHIAFGGRCRHYPYPLPLSGSPAWPFTTDYCIYALCQRRGDIACKALDNVYKLL